MTLEQQNIVKSTRAHMRQSCAVEVFDVWHAKQVSKFTIACIFDTLSH